MNRFLSQFANFVQRHILQVSGPHEKQLDIMYLYVYDHQKG